MVNKKDVEVQRGPIQPEDYTVVYLRWDMRDEVIVVNAHPPVLQVVRASLGDLIEDEKSMSRMAVTFKLKGDEDYFVFWSSESPKVMRCLGVMIQGMQDLGWMLVISTDLGQLQSRSALFFCHVVSQEQLNTGPIACIAPSKLEKMLLIDMPSHIEKELTELVQNMWGLQGRNLEESVGQSLTSELTMEDTPWSLSKLQTSSGKEGKGKEGVKLRQLLMEMIRVMRRNNYALLVNINTKDKTDSLFFQHNMALYGSPEDMFIMSLNDEDKIRLIRAPDYIIKLVGEVIKRTWRRVLKWEGKYCGSYEFRLSGNPWWADGEDTVESRYLVGTLLAELKKQGWEVEATLDVSRNMQDKTVFVMKQCPPSEQDWAVIGFHETDKIRLVGGGFNNVSLKKLIKNVIDFKDHIQESKAYGRSFEWKVSGKPFAGSFASDQRIMMHLLTKILRSMNLSGWKLVASADVSAKYVHYKTSVYSHNYQHNYQKLDNHSWFFLKDPSMILPPRAEGMQVGEENATEEVPEIMNEHETCDNSTIKWCLITWLIGGVFFFMLFYILLR